MIQSTPRILIVGDGLAGALVTWELYFRGLDFVQWSDGSPAASSVAAGMFNPVSFRRILPQWDAANHQKEARKRFERIGKELDRTLWHDVPILRIFPDEAYADLWRERAQGGHEVSPFIECMAAEQMHPSIQAPHGAGIVRDAGWVDVNAFTEGSRLKWQDSDRWSQQSWSLEKGLPAGFSQVVDCRGVGAVEDLAQFGLELRRNHGEVLRIRPEADWGETTVNNVTWALPLGDGTYRVGSTYRWDTHEPVLREETPKELVTSVCRVRKSTDEPTLLEHQAGLRPSCFDRRPILGRVSSRHPYYFACTGWGTRGVSIGPTMVRWLADALVGLEMEVPDEVHPKRFTTFTEN